MHDVDILIVEDEPAIVELITINLKHAGFSCRVAVNGAEAKKEVKQILPDLILLDWMLPDEDGIMLAKFWRSQERTKDLPIIMVTARGEDRDIVMGLDAGADDYIVKPFSTQELLARIRALLRRKAPESGLETVELCGIQVSQQERKVYWKGALVQVGSTEFRLLNYLICHPDQVLSREQILDRVWGDHVFIEERTVDVHIKRLRGVMEQAGMPPLIETIRGAGYQFKSKV